MSIIETEIWKPNPERPGTVIFDSQRIAQDIFTELEAHLKADGRLPDEYFLFDSHGNWKNGALFPKDGEVLCNVNYGGSEGIYLDIAVRYEKDVYEHSRDTGVLGWHKRMVTEGFATGKTLGDNIGDLDRMNLVASSVMAAFYGSKAEIRERYASIEDGKEQRIYPLPPGERKAAEAAARDETVETTKTINGEVRVGDWVIAEPSDEYGCLVGVVTAIDKYGTPEHGTENPGDDIHVDFMTIEYSDKAKAEIFEAFDHADMDADSFDELPLDDVIMAPDMLIRITELGHDEIDRLANDFNSAKAYCKTVMDVFDKAQSEKHAALLERLEANLSDYHNSLLSFGTREIIGIAEKMAAMSDMYTCLCDCTFPDEELDFFLQFQNPLEVAADGWLEYRKDIHKEMNYSLDTILNFKEQWLGSYPLMNDVSVDPKLTEVLAATPPIEFVSREAMQAYNMQAAEFEKLMYDLLPDASLTAMMNWKGYASDLEANETHTKAEFFLEMFIEFDLVKQHYGEKIAMKLFDYAEHFTLNPFEVRGAANHLRDGGNISEISNLAVEGVLDRTSEEWSESEQATRAFIANAGKYKRPEKTDHEQVTQSTPEKSPDKTGRATAKPKTLADKLQAGKEKAEAYKAKNPPVATKNNKKEIE